MTTQCVVAKAPRAATLSRAERLRSQPGPELGGSPHRPRTPTAAAILPPPPAGPLAPEEEAGLRRPPSWGGRPRTEGGAEGALPAGDGMSQPAFGRLGSAASGGWHSLVSGRRPTFCPFLVGDAISDRGNQREMEVVFYVEPAPKRALERVNTHTHTLLNKTLVFILFLVVYNS